MFEAPLSALYNCLGQLGSTTITSLLAISICAATDAASSEAISDLNLYASAASKASSNRRAAFSSFFKFNDDGKSCESYIYEKNFYNDKNFNKEKFDDINNFLKKNNLTIFKNL